MSMKPPRYDLLTQRVSVKHKCLPNSPRLLGEAAIRRNLASTTEKCNKDFYFDQDVEDKTSPRLKGIGETLFLSMSIIQVGSRQAITMKPHDQSFDRYAAISTPAFCNRSMYGCPSVAGVRTPPPMSWAAQLSRSITMAASARKIPVKSYPLPV